MNTVTAMIIKSFNELKETDEYEWDELAKETIGSLYLTCAWSRIWWEYYGKDSELRIFIYRCNGELVGVLPLYIQRISFGPINIKVVRLLGANIPPQVFTIPMRKEYISHIGEDLCEYFINTEKCDVISIGPLSREFVVEYNFLDNFYCGSAYKIKEVYYDKYNYFDLPDDYDEHWRSLSKNVRKNRRKYDLRLLKKRFDLKVDILSDFDQIKKDFPDFIRLHTQKWQQEGRPGFFNAWPKGESFNLKLACELSQKGSGRTRLIKITADGVPILYQFYFLFGKCCYWKVAAHNIDKKWEKYSLGETGTAVVIRSSIEENIKYIEAGLGKYEYKSRLGAEESSVSIIRLTHKKFFILIKVLCFNTVSYLITKLYHRIWYKRIKVKVPKFLHKPIWNKWIEMNY